MIRGFRCLFIGACTMIWIVMYVLTYSHAEDTSVESIALTEPELTYSDKSHWAFQPIELVALPSVKDSSWAQSRIDPWILAKLESQSVLPNQDADAVTWYRRISFMLTGLPPDLESLQRFLDDKRADAKRRAIDRMLADPDFGIRMAQHWLDIVRFAETDGFEFDKIRPEAWRYRDWVIEAINADMPYRDFITYQIAGDEVSTEAHEALIATGYLLCGPDMPDINLQEERRHVLLNGITSNFGEVVLGLQFGCAQCHDHKTDPISQPDFYRLRAFFEPLDVLRAAPKTDEETAAKEENPKTLRIVHRLDKTPESRVWIRGDFRRPGPTVEPRFPRIIEQLFDSSSSSSGITSKSDSRESLAKWLFDSRHPLTSRVLANRLWQWTMGRGLTPTGSDFGMLGAEPTHPALLDQLSFDLRNHDWSMKALIRQIVASRTFGLDSRNGSAELRRADPENDWWGRGQRYRLEGEALRDAMLISAGSLNRTMAGPGVRPPLPKEIVGTLLKDQWNVTPETRSHYRRSLYLFSRRNLRYPLFEAFDKPDPNVSCPCRNKTTIAPQALQLLNSKFAWETAKAIARRVELLKLGEQATIEQVYRLTLQRIPSETEMRQATTFLAESPQDGLSQLSLALMNTNEFIYLD